MRLPSRVLDVPPAPASAAAAHFRERLAFATDPADVHADLAAGAAAFVLVDARSPEAFARGHVPGAVSFPYRTMSRETVSRLLPAGTPVVTYCDGVHCNASTKAAARLAELGYGVKEMLDGLDGWRRDGFPVEEGAPRPPP